MKTSITAGVLPATRLNPPIRGVRVRHGIGRLGVACAIALVFTAFAPSGRAWADAAPAKEILRIKGCGACHYIPGVPGARGAIGPSLKGLKDRVMIARGVLENTPENMRDWLKNPAGILPDTMMPNLGLEDAEIDVVIEYLRKL
jgi:cytochrome c2